MFFHPAGPPKPRRRLVERYPNWNAKVRFEEKSAASD
jgi:hypothetical protein